MGALIRKVRWKELPLGSVVLEGPQVYHAALTELRGYPLLTERLRGELWQKYQLPPSTLVTVADPSLQLEAVDFRRVEREARQWLDGLPPLIDLRARSRREVFAQPDARPGLLSLSRWEDGPYTLVKDWARSLSAVVRDGGRFGSLLVGPSGLPATVGAAMGRLLTGELPSPSLSPCRLDVGIDVSFSMTATGKADFALHELQGVLAPLLARLGAAEVALWTFADGVAPAEARRPQASQTRFAPFLRRVLEVDRPGTAHLVLVVTDGQCRDRPETLRLLERLSTLGIDYLQCVLLGDDDLRRYVVGADGRAQDGVVVESELTEGQTVVIRSDDEWSRAQTEELAAVTDLAEAAHGGQVVLTWYPLFRLAALDVYERYLGRVVFTRPEASQ